MVQYLNGGAMESDPAEDMGSGMGMGMGSNMTSNMASNMASRMTSNMASGMSSNMASDFDSVKIQSKLSSQLDMTKQLYNKDSISVYTVSGEQLKTSNFNIVLSNIKYNYHQTDEIPWLTKMLNDDYIFILLYCDSKICGQCGIDIINCEYRDDFILPKYRERGLYKLLLNNRVNYSESEEFIRKYGDKIYYLFTEFSKPYRNSKKIKTHLNSGLTLLDKPINTKFKSKFNDQTYSLDGLYLAFRTSIGDLEDNYVTYEFNVNFRCCGIYLGNGKILTANHCKGMIEHNYINITTINIGENCYKIQLSDRIKFENLGMDEDYKDYAILTIPDKLVKDGDKYHENLDLELQRVFICLDQNMLPDGTNNYYIQGSRLPNCEYDNFKKELVKIPLNLSNIDLEMFDKDISSILKIDQIPYAYSDEELRQLPDFISEMSKNNPLLLHYFQHRLPKDIFPPHLLRWKDGHIDIYNLKENYNNNLVTFCTIDKSIITNNNSGSPIYFVNDKSQCILICPLSGSSSSEYYNLDNCSIYTKVSPGCHGISNVNGCSVNNPFIIKSYMKIEILYSYDLGTFNIY